MASVGVFILQAAGYDGTLATQSESAMTAISYTLNMLPTILLGIMTLLALLFFNIDKIMPTVTEELKKSMNRMQNEIGGIIISVC